ncbi:MAG: hypothetical protein J1F31_03585 [Erysipelotrichales bacterium]|nr:hypothetical protein [Erysipelotrichales bacterium]
MEIVLRIFISSFIFVNLFYCTAIFISQYYDYKRLLILLKQRTIECSYHNLIIFSLFCLSLGLVFNNVFISEIVICLALLINIFFTKKLIFKFTRRSISFLIIYLAAVSVSAIFADKISFYIFASISLLFQELLVIFSNLILSPYEHLIRRFYINKAKKKIKDNPNLKIIAITGSFGKTSFKNYLYSILCGQYNVIKTQGSINTPMGICKFINNSLTPYDDILILELGVDTPNTMKRFFKIFHPHIGVITSIGEMHLATFKTIENIQKEKLSLFNNLVGEKAKFYNKDCSLINVLNKDNTHPYSIEEIKIESMNIEGTKFEFNGNTYFAPIFGKHQLINLLGAIKVAKYLNVKEDILSNRLCFVKAENHRLSVEKINNTYVIDDAYNANFIGLSEAINTITSFTGTKGIILNGVIEAGTKTKEINFNLGCLLGNFDEVVILSNSSQYLKEGLESISKKFKVFSNYSEGYTYLLKHELNYVLLCSKADKEFIK